MLEKASVIDTIEITRNGLILVRRADLIMEDGVEIASTIHRHVLSPGESLSGQDERVVAVSNAVWTSKVIEDYEKEVEEKEASIVGK